MTITLLSALTLLFSCASGEPVTLEQLTADLCRHDVIFLGEEHDNTEGHKMQLQIIRSLHEAGKDVVVSMEMFERDVQGVLDDYLLGRIDEETFLSHSRPWPNYKRHYRPIIEFAKAHGMDVIAANAPRRSARKVAQGGVDPSAHVARSTTSPRNQYWLLFKEAMKEHPGEVSDKAMMNMYAAQCIKDDTMAEAIVDYMNSRPHRKPLIVHICGKFHSDHGLGTHARVVQRSPLTKTCVITMEAFEEKPEEALLTGRKQGHYLIAVPVEPKKKKKKAGDEKEAGEAVAEEEPIPEEPVEEEPVLEEPIEEEGEELLPAGLGIMPDYASEEPGVLVSGVSEGGAAEKAGIKEDDLIIKIGKESIESLEDYMAVMSDLFAGQKVKITLERGDDELVLSVTLSARRR